MDIDSPVPFSRITLRGDVYEYNPAVTGLAEGYSVSGTSLYLTRNGISYKLLTNRNVLNWPGEYLAGVSDMKSSLEAVMGFGKHINLHGDTITVSTLDVTKNITNGEIKAIADAGSFINLNSAKLQRLKVNCASKAVRRAVHLKSGSVRATVKDVEVFDSTGATNANGIFVDANNVKDFLIKDVFIRNLTSVGNGSQGDADGPCRGIIVGTALDPAPTASTVSSGEIDSIRIRDLAPFEDCDGIVIQIYDAGSVMLSAAKIRVKNIDTHNVRKRAVKIQANDVTVTNVTAYCDTTDTAMYAIVSLYGDNGVAENIIGRGRISNGVDSAYGLNHLNGLFMKSERTGDDTLSGIGAGLLINSGQMDARNVWSEGAEYVVAIRDALGNTPYVKISGIRGQGYSGVVRFQQRAGNTIGNVFLDDISASSSASNKAPVSLDITANTIALISIRGVKRITSPFTGADINLAGGVIKAIVRDCEFNSGSTVIGVVMTTGTLVASDITSGKTYAVQINQTSGSRIDVVDGVVRITDSTNARIGSCTTISESGTNTYAKLVYA